MAWNDVFKWVGDNSKNLAEIGQFASPIVQGWSAYNQNKQTNKQNDLLQQNYDYNKSINDREIAKENMTQDNTTSAFADVFGTNKKKKPLTDYYGTTNYQG